MCLILFLWLISFPCWYARLSGRLLTMSPAVVLSLWTLIMIAQGDKTMFCTKYSILDWKTGKGAGTLSSYCSFKGKTVQYVTWLYGGNRIYFSRSEAWLYFYRASTEHVLIHLYITVSPMCLTNTEAVFLVFIYFTSFDKVALNKASLTKLKIKESLRLGFNISTSCWNSWDGNRGRRQS